MEQTEEIFYLNPSWNNKYISERKRDKQNQVLSLQTSYAIAKIEAVSEFQATLIEKLKQEIRTAPENTQPQYIRKKTLIELLDMVIGLQPKVGEAPVGTIKLGK